MKGSLFFLITSLVMIAVVSSANAQFDHMSCFKVKDPAKFSATLTLDALQDAFDPTGQCLIKGKAKMFCVPTDKQVDEYLVDKAPAVPLTVGGQVLTSDMLCYKAKCPAATIPDDEVVDQFGVRTVSKFKMQFVCTPAYKTAPMCVLPDPPQCPFNDPCTNGTCSSTRGGCSQQGDCPLAPNEECCCSGICI